jgi:hypothetical protein
VPRRTLAILAGLGLASALPPLLAPIDGVPPGVEVADHVLPGALAAVVALVVLARGARARELLPAVALAALAGLWQVATHVTLVLDAGQPGRPAGAVALHALPGVVLLAAALWPLLRPRPAR